jgi:RNA 2',3'-cyclic 3'-phosphodiesterase
MANDQNTRRLFIGIPLTEEAKRGVGGVMKNLNKKHWKVKWETPEKWHITLVFIGNVGPKDQIQKIRTVIKDAAVEKRSIGLRFKGLGQYPEPSRVPRLGERIAGRTAKTIRLRPKETQILPKIIWLRLKGDLQGLSRLQKRTAQGLEAKGIAYDHKPFSPHLTLGRVKSEGSRGEKLEIAKEIEKQHVLDVPQAWEVNRLCLYESVLKPEGSEYQVIDEVQLKQ